MFVNKVLTYGLKISTRFYLDYSIIVFHDCIEFFLNVSCNLQLCTKGLHDAETWTFRAVDQKHMESFEMWYWRRMEKISWVDHARNEEVLLGVKQQKNILHEISKRKANWIGHIFVQKLPSTTGYRRKDKRGNRSDTKTRKKTQEATG